MAFRWSASGTHLGEWAGILTWRFRAAEARERIEQELHVARRIQQELLPEATPELDGWKFAEHY